VIEQIVSSPEARRSTKLLPIHPYFLNPQPSNDISLEELSQLYFGCDRKGVTQLTA
jgi:sucrose-phosphate synthase